MLTAVTLQGLVSGSNDMPSSRTIRVGAMTLKITREEKQAGLFYERLFGLCDRLLPGCGCDTVLLPERSALRPEDRQPLDGPHFRRFAALARKHRVRLLAPLAELDRGACYNTHAVISPDGRLEHARRKVHLAPGEERTTRPGEHFEAFDLPWCRAGVLICFDNHFPESSRCLALAGARLLFWPAYGNLARPGVDGARCIDNHLYFVAAGVVDLSCDVAATAFTRGTVMNPAGETVAQTAPDDGLAVAELPLDPATGRLAPWPADPDYLARRVPAAYRALCP